MKTRSEEPVPKRSRNFDDSVRFAIDKNARSKYKY